MPSSCWRFDEIAETEPDRAAALEQAPSERGLLSALRQTFDGSLSRGETRFGYERASDPRGGHRIVIQFHVGCQLFDWFFNGRTGYRAAFQRSPNNGRRFNAEVIETIRDRAGDGLPEHVPGRQLDEAFRDVGAIRIRRDTVTSSLSPELSKIWFCPLRIGRDGGIEQVALGLGGPRIKVEGAGRWAAPHPEDADAWVAVFGAFLGPNGPYQPKCPQERAKQLHKRGET